MLFVATHAHDKAQYDNHKQLQAVSLNNSRQWELAKTRFIKPEEMSGA